MLNQLLSVFLESRCLFCDRAASSGHSPTADYLCQYCEARLLAHQFANDDRLKLERTQAVFAWGGYDGQLKRAIALMKYDRNPKIAKVLGTLLGNAWLKSRLNERHPKITAIPIPMHQQKQKLRGFNQAEIIARSFCQVTGYQLQAHGLIRTRATTAMFELDSAIARTKNLAGAIEVSYKLPKHPVLLIDDIYTTGTTVREACKMLQQKKLRVFGVAVAAKAGYQKGDAQNYG